MAHFARLDEANVVTQVIVVKNDCTLNENGIEDEAIGIQFCQSLYGDDTIWKQTSYNANLRKNYAGIGFIYDENRDAFIAPKPFNSWQLNETTCKWEAPIPMPEAGGPYQWDEATLSWVAIS